MKNEPQPQRSDTFGTNKSPHFKRVQPAAQEWTPEYIIMLGVDNYVIAHRICDVHKADRKHLVALLEDALRTQARLRRELDAACQRAYKAETWAEDRDKLRQQLTAERKELSKALKGWTQESRRADDAEAAVGENCRTIAKLEQQLTAERENVKHYEVANKTLLELAADDEQQLLAAQATLAALPRSLGINKADFSALEAHDDEVRTLAYAKGAQDQHGEDILARKPLVDALEQAHEKLDQKIFSKHSLIGDVNTILVDALEKISSLPLSCTCGHIAADAMAKVKEGNH